MVEENVDNALKKSLTSPFRNPTISSLYHKQILGDMIVLKERIELSKTPRVLDAGCGWGRISIILSKHLDKMTEIIGVDLDLSSIRHGRYLAHDFSFVRAHMGYLPFRNRIFEAIVSSKAIHEIQNKRERSRASDEFARTLKNEGVIYVLDLFARSYVAKFIRCVLHILASRVERYYYMKEFENDLKSKGFKIIRSNCIPWPPFNLSALCSYVVMKK